MLLRHLPKPKAEQSINQSETKKKNEMTGLNENVKVTFLSLATSAARSVSSLDLDNLSLGPSDILRDHKERNKEERRRRRRRRRKNEKEKKGK